MTPLRGSYYDGKSSLRQEVLISRSGHELLLSAPDREVRYPVTGIEISPPLGGLGRTLRFPDNATCELAPGADPETALGIRGARFPRLVGQWERSLPLTRTALLITALLVIGFVTWGIPFLARQVADAVPPATEILLGRETLAMLDRIAFTPSRLPESRRREVESLFRGMLPNLPGARRYRLEFRSGDRIGANAFALPSGIIVVTDGLVTLARNDAELMGVLAHEASHVRNRHALRQVLQNSSTGLVVALITGDVLSVTSLSAALPTMLIDASYSRDFEREADSDAAAFLDRRGMPRQSYADMLIRLEADHDRRSGGPERMKRDKALSPADWFSSHPETAERVDRVTGRR